MTACVMPFLGCGELLDDSLCDAILGVWGTAGCIRQHTAFLPPPPGSAGTRGLKVSSLLPQRNMLMINGHFHTLFGPFTSLLG